MATVRIYKIAELLGTSSQEIVALLKRDHGIEVKSASSTVEEIVARQFVERLARQRGVTLPSGDIFAEGAAAKVRKPGLAKKVEPPKPAAPSLPPPRLIKTLRPHAPAEPSAEPVELPEPEPVVEEQAAAPPTPVHVPVEPGPRIRVEQPATAVEPPPAPAAQHPREEAPAPGAAAVSHAEPAAAAPSAEAEQPAEAGSAEQAAAEIHPAGQPAAPAAPPKPSAAPGRLVPPTLRLRVEEHRPVAAQRAEPVAPRPRPAAPSAVVRPPAAQPPRPATTPAARPGAIARPAAAARPLGARPSAQPVSGGPRPLPSQPIRPQPAGTRPGGPGTLPARPAVGRAPGRPGGGAYRPPTSRGPRRDSGRDMGGGASAVAAAPPPVTRTITLAEGMTVKDLSEKLDVRAKEILKKLLDRRIMMTINTTLDTETATWLAREFGADVKMRSFEEEILETGTDDSKPEDVTSRAPVVTVMGHVDHGKTTLLDAIRETRVAEREAGGITQHIGAYHVQVHNRSVVFLDTPGHEAFTLMRARGARVTDIVILVVAADDGVMPQTREAVDHARAANVPIIVAINKIDKPDANPDRVKQSLSDLGLVPEQWGGQTVMVELSAKKRLNIELLLEMILLVTDIGELKANPKLPAQGTVLEAKLDKGRGPVATVLVQNGTLHVGDTVIAGPIIGKVRALLDDRGRVVKIAGPSTPVEILGLAGLPQPGDSFQAIADAAKARQVVTFRQTQAKEKALGAKASRLTLESLQQQIAEGSVKELPIVIKADVQGSAEVLGDTLTKLSDDKVKVRIIHAGVGAINESDVLLSSASNAIIVGFNVRPDRGAADLAERERVEIRQHSIIYNVIDEMKKAMAGLLEPTFREVRMGSAEVRDTFRVPKFGVIAGCMVIDGVVARSGDAQARLLRDHVVVYEGKIGSLRRFKDDVSEVKAGFECGIGFEKFNDIKVGDVIEVFKTEKLAQAVAN